MEESPREKNQKNITDYLLQRGDWICAVPSDSHSLLISFRCFVAMAYVKFTYET